MMTGEPNLLGKPASKLNILGVGRDNFPTSGLSHVTVMTDGINHVVAFGPVICHGCGCGGVVVKVAGIVINKFDMWRVLVNIRRFAHDTLPLLESPPV